MENITDKSILVKARLASTEYGREITPEQVVAVEYFAKEEGLAYRLYAEEKKHGSEQIEKNVKDIEANVKKSLFKSGNLDNKVKEYKEEISDPVEQDFKRQNRLQMRQERDRQIKLQMHHR